MTLLIIANRRDDAKSVYLLTENVSFQNLQVVFVETSLYKTYFNVAIACILLTHILEWCVNPRPRDDPIRSNKRPN